MKIKEIWWLGFGLGFWWFLEICLMKEAESWGVWLRMGSGCYQWKDLTIGVVCTKKSKKKGSVVFGFWVLSSWALVRKWYLRVQLCFLFSRISNNFQINAQKSQFKRVSPQLFSSISQILSKVTRGSPRRYAQKSRVTQRSSKSKHRFLQERTRESRVTCVYSWCFMDMRVTVISDASNSH